jgi:hypothetical protein
VRLPTAQDCIEFGGRRIHAGFHGGGRILLSNYQNLLLYDNIAELPSLEVTKLT